MKELYKTAEYAFTTIPTYPSGQIGFVLCSLREEDFTASIPQRKLSSDKLRYYNDQVHSAAFVLPQFAKKKVC